VGHGEDPRHRGTLVGGVPRRGLPDLEEDLLRDLFRLGVVDEDAADESEDAGGDLIVEIGERGAIPGSDPGQEIFAGDDGIRCRAFVAFGHEHQHYRSPPDFS
jgi:hypothetical protein